MSSAPPLRTVDCRVRWDLLRTRWSQLYTQLIELESAAMLRLAFILLPLTLGVDYIDDLNMWDCHSSPIGFSLKSFSLKSCSSHQDNIFQVFFLEDVYKKKCSLDEIYASSPLLPFPIYSVTFHPNRIKRFAFSNHKIYLQFILSRFSFIKMLS